MREPSRTGRGRAPDATGAPGATSAASARCAWRVVYAPAGHLGDGSAPLPSFGSAALISGEWIAPRLGGRALILTCCHVCSATPRPSPPRSLVASDAAVDFCDGADRAGPLLVRRVLWESPRHELDAALLDIGEPPAWASEAAARLTHRPAQLGEVVTLRGSLLDEPAQLARSLIVSAAQSSYLYYDAAPGRGLSGAPLFGEDGALVGLHRGDSRVLPAHLALASRHGIALEAILAAARRALDA